MLNEKTVNLGSILLSLSDALDLFTPALSSHQLRTAFVTWEMAKAAGLSQELLEKSYIAALLHDIGALTPEEKLSLHEFEEIDPTGHCVLGEILFSYVPSFRKAGVIVRNHHRRFDEWGLEITESPVLESQILQLADEVERLIDRKKFILLQKEDITKRVVSGSQKGVYHPTVAGLFLEVSNREEFWLDLVNPRLYSHLLDRGPLSNREIECPEVSSITELFGQVIDFRSHYTATHTTGVSTSAQEIARHIGFTEKELEKMKMAGNLHDLGKLAVSNCILEKPGRLTQDEFAIMKQHTYYTYTLLNSIKGLKEVAEWSAFHHEKLDGSGYPFHLKAECLSLGSRIMMVADIFTACAEVRPYRTGMVKEQVIAIVKRQGSAGKLDPLVIEALFDNYDQILSMTQKKQKLAHEFYMQKFAAQRIVAACPENRLTA